MKKRITVFTPAYNRADLLPRLYNSLLEQPKESIVWLIVDDGSTDNTKELVSKWIDEGNLHIRYFFKENGGLHTAYNVGIEKADTELFICIDSDDFMPPGSIRRILDLWDTEGSDAYAGIVGLDYTLEGKPIGSRLPDQKAIHFLDIKMNYRDIGDTKLVHRTTLLKQVAPMPIFEGEKNFNPSYLFLKVDQFLPLLILNENICFVEYQPDGMSYNILHQYRNSPNSFMEIRKLYLSLQNTNLQFKIRHIVHYISACLFARKYRSIFRNPFPFLTLLLLPFGILLNIYIRIKTAK